MAFTSAQISDWLRQAGLPETLIPVMTAIGLAEQPSDPFFVRNCPGNNYCLAGQKPEKSVGIFQINVLAHSQYNNPQGIAWLQNPINNAKAAVSILQSQGLRAWGSYVDGRYKQYLGRSVSGNPLAITTGAQQTAPKADFSQYLGVSVVGEKNRYLLAFAILVIIFIFAFN
jgi:hypothetical protein